MLVVAPNRRVARWARRVIPQLHPASAFIPLVVGPDEIPLVIRVEDARLAPELAVLSAMAHWRDFPDTLAPVVAALAATEGLEPDARELYFHLTVQTLNRAAKALLRTLVAHTPFISSFGKSLIEEGRQDGRQQGRHEGKQDALLQIFRARGIEITEGQRARIAACRDTALLDTWISRAVTAASIESALGH